VLNGFVKIFDDIGALSRAEALHILKVATQAPKTKGQFTWVLSGGGTPETLFRLMTEAPYKNSMPWAKTYVFWGDERLVPPEHAESNFGQARNLMLNHVPIPPENVFRFKGELEANTACKDFGHQLARFAGDGSKWPHFDLVLLGLGSDGHTASLFPGSLPDNHLSSPIAVVTANYGGRPANRITMTPFLINLAKNINFMVTGIDKAKAVAASIEGKNDPLNNPAQRIKPKSGKLLWLLDVNAASALGSTDTT
jgi:6-phosphogluconolactonase